MTAAYIALGSNLQHPAEQLGRAVAALAALPQSRLDAVSSVYRSAAVGPGPQPDYLNAVALLQTDLPALQLLDALQGIEQAQGRIRDIKWGPRTLDLDLLLYGDETLSTPRLTVPHPQMAHRHFVLYPLRELCGPHYRLPCGKVLQTLLQHCPETGLVRTRHPLGSPAPGAPHDRTAS
ncbi:MAG: 2-amino-4-hydroxy-6-hydroxymethyldihydropteridine diphosphokinase [Halioglobus sp.]|nr:2-amino-4-hydroxy-6-hydroxymethyldihydropteridine diphosphokinase [Halioglobus sp.]